MYFVLALIIAAALGLIPATIAKQKGYSFGLWWFYGWMLFIVAIIHVACLEDKNTSHTARCDINTSQSNPNLCADSGCYSTMFELPRNRYQTGAPVAIASASLVKDERSGDMLVMIMFRNVSDKTIKAIEAVVFPKDVFGKPLGEEIRKQYIDLNVHCGGTIGRGVYIHLPTNTVRVIDAAAIAVMFDDGSVWEASDELWVAGTAPMIETVEAGSKQATIATGGKYAIALRSDGTVVATGSKKFGICDVSGWRDVVAVYANSSHTVGLKTDGTVVAVGSNGSGRCDVSGWSDVVAAATGAYHTVGLKSDGTVVAVGDRGFGQCDVSEWRDIVAVAAGAHHTIGLKSDGTVVAAGWNNSGQCEVLDWYDILAIDAGDAHTVGLRSDGTVLAVGNEGNGRLDVSRWEDIIDISAGAFHTVGVKSDGTVVATGSSSYGQCDVSDWANIVEVAAGGNCTIGLRSDGTVVATGESVDKQYNVSNWMDIRLPE